VSKTKEDSRGMSSLRSAPPPPPPLVSRSGVEAEGGQVQSHPLAPLGGAVAIELIDVSNIGSLTLTGSPYVEVEIQNKNRESQGTATQWSTKRTSSSPVWNATHFVGPAGYRKQKGDRLNFRVYNSEDVNLLCQVMPICGALIDSSSQDGLVGAADFSLDGIQPEDPRHAKEYVVRVQPVQTPEQSVDSLGSTPLDVLLQSRCELRFRILIPPPTRKRVFFIRHGQSEWNKATEETYNVPKMIDVDHPLSPRGIEQAEKLRMKIRKACNPGPHSTPAQMAEIAEFLSAPLVLSSPLSRALETAMVSLRDHPTAQRNGIKLLSVARELKNLFGLDTIGEMKGDAIAKNVREDLTTRRELQELGADDFDWSSIAIDANDTHDRWWDVIQFPSEKEKHVESLLMHIRMMPERSAVLVGHSLAFRHMMQKYGGTAVSENFKTKKIKNCGVAVVDFDFNHQHFTLGDDGDSIPTPVRSASLLLDSDFMD